MLMNTWLLTWFEETILLIDLAVAAAALKGRPLHLRAH
jgi:hypothetical protein